MSILCKGKNCLYNPKAPMSICGSHYVFCCSSLEKASFLTVQVVFHMIPHPSVKTCTCPETISNFQFCCNAVVFKNVQDCSEII